MAYYGSRFPQWGIEALIEGTSKIFRHYMMRGLVGIQFKLSSELLTIEIDLLFQLLLLNYQRYHRWLTNCYLKE
jgi:hypothetical protein